MNKKVFVTTAFVTVLACASAVANSNFTPKEPPMGASHQVKGVASDFAKGRRGGEFKNEGHSEKARAERKKRVEEFEKRLNLTPEQKAKVEKNRENSRKKMEKIMQQEKKLFEQKRAIMEQNKKDFEAILTDEQKTEFKKMHEERRAEMEKMRKQRLENKQKTNPDKKTTKKSIK